MDLNYGAEYEDFRKEVQAFCKEYQGVSFKSNSNVVADTLNDSSASKKSKKDDTLVFNIYNFSSYRFRSSLWHLFTFANCSF